MGNPLPSTCEDALQHTGPLSASTLHPAHDRHGLAARVEVRLEAKQPAVGHCRGAHAVDPHLIRGGWGGQAVRCWQAHPGGGSGGDGQRRLDRGGTLRKGDVDRPGGPADRHRNRCSELGQVGRLGCKLEPAPPRRKGLHADEQLDDDRVRAGAPRVAPRAARGAARVRRGPGGPRLHRARRALRQHVPPRRLPRAHQHRQRVVGRLGGCPPHAVQAAEQPERRHARALHPALLEVPGHREAHAVDTGRRVDHPGHGREQRGLHRHVRDEGWGRGVLGRGEPVGKSAEAAVVQLGLQRREDGCGNGGVLRRLVRLVQPGCHLGHARRREGHVRIGDGRDLPDHVAVLVLPGPVV
eukprot:m.278040 g.278040  ORF g.278040 m.278040 type:complete len:354 (+) comp26936_c1_seq3:227-1288(+)